MATEQEELKLTVTLADNASAGLEKLQGTKARCESARATA
jgi:hypothetical protein